MSSRSPDDRAAWISDEQAEDLATWALRTRSPAGRAVVASRARSGDPRWIRALARLEAWGADRQGIEQAVALLQPLADEEHTEQSATLLAQALVHLGRRTEALAVLGTHTLTSAWAWGVRADAANPWISGIGTPSPEDVTAWLAVLNEPFDAAGLEPVRLDPPPGTPASSPFASLRATPRAKVDDAECVTVVMSAFNPDQDIRMAARSVLDQSWTNLQLLVIDDASPDTSAAEALAGLDDHRLEIVTAEINGGTYQARNIALLHARGEWITVHDSDDFAHPRRLELQVEAIRGTRTRMASRSHAIRAYPDLTLTYVGYPPSRLNASSLLFRREAVDLVGGFDLVRKSGDMEYPLRLQAVRPGAVLDMPSRTPLAITQLRTGSLSRSDAVPGWTHWTRIAYRDFYSAWHETIAKGEDPRHAVPAPRATAGPRPFAVPTPTFLATVDRPGAPTAADVVVVSDLRRGRTHADVSARVRALASHGLTVAVAHLEGPHPPVSRRSLLDASSMGVVNDGTAFFTQHHETLDVGVVLVEDPSCLLLREDDGSAWTVGRVRVVEEGDPATLTAATAAAASLWRAPVELVTSTVAAAASPRPARSPERRPGTRRVVLAHPVGGTSKGWALAARELLDHLPDRDEVEVRLADDGNPARAALGTERLPAGWVPMGLTGPRAGWLTGADAVVLTTLTPDLDPAAGTLARQAVAAGALAVVPSRLAHLGDLVIATDEPAASVVTALWSDSAAWSDAANRARNAASRTAEDSVSALLGTPPQQVRDRPPARPIDTDGPQGPGEERLIP